MTSNSDQELREQLSALQTDHRNLDQDIITLEDSVNADQLTIRRLKKQKLVLKEQIQKIEDELLPDIIA